MSNIYIFVWTRSSHIRIAVGQLRFLHICSHHWSLGLLLIQFSLLLGFFSLKVQLNVDLSPQRSALSRLSSMLISRKSSSPGPLPEITTRTCIETSKRVFEGFVNVSQSSTFSSRKMMCTWEDVVKGHRFPSLAFCSYESEKVRVEVRKWEGQLSLHLAKCGQNAGWKQEKDEKKLNVTEMHLTLDSPQDCPWMRKSLKSDDITKVIDSITCWKHLDNQLSTDLGSSEKKMDLSEMHLRLEVAIGQEFSCNWNLEREKALNWLCLITCTAGHRWPQVAAWSSADFGFKFKMHAILDP